jgi:hypothetical protein
MDATSTRWAQQQSLAAQAAANCDLRSTSQETENKGLRTRCRKYRRERLLEAPRRLPKSRREGDIDSRILTVKRLLVIAAPQASCKICKLSPVAGGNSHTTADGVVDLGTVELSVGQRSRTPWNPCTAKMEPKWNHDCETLITPWSREPLLSLQSSIRYLTPHRFPETSKLTPE